MRIPRGSNRDADAIGVRIARNDQVGPSRLGLGDGRFERAGILGVRDVVGDVGKITVGVRCDATM